ncbi:hypothetical protein OG937_10715 [Streptomyces sp. NBC_00510]
MLATAVVAALGKRGEQALTGLGALTDQLQEELTAKRAEITEKNAALAEKDAALAAEAARRATAEAETARLRAQITQMGGTPT